MKAFPKTIYAKVGDGGTGPPLAEPASNGLRL